MKERERRIRFTPNELHSIRREVGILLSSDIPKESKDRAIKQTWEDARIEKMKRRLGKN